MKFVKSKDRIGFIVLAFALGANIAVSLSLYVIFLYAFTHNNQVLLYINSIHENWFELFLLTGVIVFGIFVFFVLCRVYKKRQEDGEEWSIMDKHCYYGCLLEYKSREGLAMHYLKYHSSDKGAVEWARRYLNSLTPTKHIDPVCGQPYEDCRCETTMKLIDRFYLK